MRGTLLLAILSVQSSYLREVEVPLQQPTDVPDTLQWWIGNDMVWRVKTFAVDHDIHAYSVGPPDPGTLELARTNNQKHYGDVIAAQHVLEFTDCGDAAEVTRVCGLAGLEPRVEVAALGFAFWRPDDTKYRTQSQPD
jgi:hypothetical protein